MRHTFDFVSGDTEVRDSLSVNSTFVGNANSVQHVRMNIQRNDLVDSEVRLFVVKMITMLIRLMLGQGGSGNTIFVPFTYACFYCRSNVLFC